MYSQPGQVTTTDPGDIPDRVTSPSLYKVGGKEEGRGGWSLPSQAITTYDGTLLWDG